MKGILFWWHGSLETIPDGWALCDGTQGTPDLAGLFVPGAGSSYNPGDSDPLGTHKHTFMSSGHAHDIASGLDLASGVFYGDCVGSVTAAGSTASYWPRPPYKVLPYIMKLP